MSFKESCQPMKIAVGVDVSHDGHKCIWVHQVLEWLIVQVKLTGNAYHDAVQLFLGQRSKGSYAQLAAQHDIERMGFCTSRFVAQL